MQKTYKGSEIIFGTRDEYLKLQDKLDALRKLTCISQDKQIKDVNFYIRKDRNDTKPNLYCTFLQNEKTLRGLKEHIEKDILHTYIYGRNISEVLKNNNNKYFIPHSAYYAFVRDEDQKEFGKIAKEVLNSDFCNKSNFSYINGEEARTSLSKSSNGIHINNSLELIYDKPNFICQLDYLSDEDIIRILGHDDMPVTKDMIERMLNVKVKAEYLTEYERNLIDNSISASKPIYIDDSIDEKKKITLSIEEDEEKIRIMKK